MLTHNRTLSLKILKQFCFLQLISATYNGEFISPAYNEELHNLYSSLSIIRMIKSRRMRWVGHIAQMGEKGSAYGILVGKLEGKRPLGRPGCRWADNIKMDLREIGWDVVDWIDMTQDR
jgi:hypothetical protein